MISPKQALLARTMVEKSQADVAKTLGWAHQTLSKLEKGSVNPPASRLKELEEFYENEGVEFLDGDGVRKKQAYMQSYSGTEGFQSFLDDVYKTTEKQGGEICIFNVDARYWVDLLGEENWNRHSERMANIKHPIDDKILIKEGDWFFPADSYAEYRWFPEELFNDQTLYAYGKKLAFLSFKNNDVEILSLEKAEFNSGFRALFNIAWEKVAKKPNK